MWFVTRLHLIDRVARPALHRAPGLITAIHWDEHQRLLTASGDQSAAGNQLDLFIPSNQEGLNVSLTGMSIPQTTQEHGGQRIVATANGGAWSVRVAP